MTRKRLIAKERLITGGRLIERGYNFVTSGQKWSYLSIHETKTEFTWTARIFMTTSKSVWLASLN